MAKRTTKNEVVNNLIKRIEKIEDEIEMGDELIIMYDGTPIAHYYFIEWSPDSKTPMDWFSGVMCFEVTMKNLDERKLALDYKKCEDSREFFKKLLSGKIK